MVIEVSGSSDIIEKTTKKIIFYWDFNSKNLFLKLKSSITTPKYMKDAVPLLTDMQFRWIEDKNFVSFQNFKSY